MKKAKIVLIAICTVFLVASALSLRAYTIAGPSMAPSFYLNDIALANHNAYWLGTPERGDVVVYFDSAKNSAAVKRIIGIPGDRVKLVENLVWINEVEQKQTLRPNADFRHIPKENGMGQVVAEERIFGKPHLVTFTPGRSPKRNFGAATLGEGEYFVLGDHRDNSADSRYIGPIRAEQIIAKVIWRYHKGV